MYYVIAAILSNLSYAIVDNINGIAAKKNSPLKLAFWAALFGILIFTLPLVLFFQNEISKLTPGNITLILGLNVILSLGYLSFVTGMNKGSVTLTGVIAGSFPAVTTFVALLFFKETITAAQGIAIMVILGGVILSSLEGNIATLLEDIKSSAIIYAFGAFILWGIYFAFVRIPVEQIGWFIPQYAASVVGLPLYLLIAAKTGEKDVMKKPNLASIIAIIAIMQITGSMLFNYALTKGPTSIVAPIAGSSPAVFVIIAYFVFKERLKTIQWIGIILAVSGIVSLTLLSS